MSVLRRSRAAGVTRTERARWLALALVVSPVLGACNDPFEPFQESTQGPFSMFGYLDLQSERQWIRVTPVRQNLVADRAPVDAVVTLENLGSGRTVTLRDSVFEFPDRRVGGVAHAHNFWTTDRLERGAAYRLKAMRSDGATTTALVEMPGDAEVSLSYYEGPPDLTGDNSDGFRDVLRIYVRGEHILYSDVIYLVRDLVGIQPMDSIVAPQIPIRIDHVLHEFTAPRNLTKPGVLLDLRRLEARFAVARSDWPFQPGLSPAEAALPGKGPSNVENGFGFVGGLAVWSIPLARCNPLEARPGGHPVCGHVVDASSAAIVGRVVGICGQPIPLTTIRLTERFAGGGAAVFAWQSGWDGTYAFQGLEPGADLTLAVGAEAAVIVPQLAPGERFVARDISVPIACSAGVGAPSTR